VTHKFVREPQIIVENRVVADNDGVFETPALDQALFLEHPHFPQETERARGRDFLFVGLRRDGVRGVLRAHRRVVVRDGHGQARFLRGKHAQGLVVRFEIDGLLDFDVLALGILFDEPGVLQGVQERQRAPVADRRLIGVDLDIHVVDADPGDRRQDVFDRVDGDAVDANGGAARHIDHVIHIGLDGRTVGQIDAVEGHAAPRFRGFEGDGGQIPGMQADT